MTDLISRSELLDKIYSDKRPTFYDGVDVANWQMNCIYCAPAIEAEPVRHGKWVWNNDAIDWGIGAWVCSECGGRNENIHAAKPGTVKAYTNPYIYAGTKFCPNCGARMIQGGAE